MTDIVLVHGAWHGGWCWSRVADDLAARGHRVFTPTLTGLGDRAHLLDDRVNLSTHIADIVGLIRFEELNRFVLCGHSYGGMVITGACAAIGERVGAAVYLDAFVPLETGSCAELAGTPIIDSLAIPPPAAATFGLEGYNAAWVDAKMTPHPVATVTERLSSAGNLNLIKRKHFVLATGHPSQVFVATHRSLGQSDDWTLWEVDGGHDLMVDRSERVAEILDLSSRDFGLPE